MKLNKYEELFQELNVSSITELSSMFSEKSIIAIGSIPIETLHVSVFDYNYALLFRLVVNIIRTKRDLLLSDMKEGNEEWWWLKLDSYNMDEDLEKDNPLWSWIDSATEDEVLQFMLDESKITDLSKFFLGILAKDSITLEEYEKKNNVKFDDLILGIRLVATYCMVLIKEDSNYLVDVCGNMHLSMLELIQDCKRTLEINKIKNNKNEDI